MPSCICLRTSAQQKAPKKFRVCFQKSSMVFLRLQHPCIQVELWPQSKWNYDHHLHPALHPLSTHTVRTPSHFSLNIFSAASNSLEFAFSPCLHFIIVNHWSISQLQVKNDLALHYNALLLCFSSSLNLLSVTNLFSLWMQHEGGWSDCRPVTRTTSVLLFVYWKYVSSIQAGGRGNFSPNATYFVSSLRPIMSYIQIQSLTHQWKFVLKTEIVLHVLID